MVKASTCDYNQVYVGDVYYEDGTYAGILTFSGTELTFETEDLGSGTFRITARKEYNNGYVVITSYLYDNDGNPYIRLAGRRYNKA